MFKTITVTLFNKNEVGRDEFGAPVNVPDPVDVPGILVYPASNDAVVSDLQLYGKKAAYQICIPKGDTHEWEDRLVRFFGHTFRTYGTCAEYIDGNVPLKWNKQIRCERYE